MRNLLAMKQIRFYHDYKVIVAAGSDAGIGVAAWALLRRVTRLERRSLAGEHWPHGRLPAHAG